MKLSIYFLFMSALFFGCTTNVVRPKLLFTNLPNTYLIKSNFSNLPNFNDENCADILKQFLNDCKTQKSKKLYGHLCEKASTVVNAKKFLISSFQPYIINTKDGKNEGILTGYYEAKLLASRKKSKRYKYPVYKTPKDLISVNLSSIYPQLKHYRLRGRLKGNKIVPYDTRAESKKKLVDADVICYCDSKIDRFFLEIQGSGIAKLDDNSTIFIGYDNQNGHRYRAIGKYLVAKNELSLKNISLQSIKKWLLDNPKRVDEVLNYNKSIVYFKEKKSSATGALGLQLMAKRSVAVDKKYIPLGSMLYLSADLNNKTISRVVFAQDTGGAIKGAVRADIFLGSGDEALKIAGKLKATLRLWILLPKNEIKKS